VLLTQTTLQEFDTAVTFFYVCRPMPLGYARTGERVDAHLNFAFALHETSGVLSRAFGLTFIAVRDPCGRVA
jgi:hypothetical protein